MTKINKHDRAFAIIAEAEQLGLLPDMTEAVRDLINRTGHIDGGAGAMIDFLEREIGDRNCGEEPAEVADRAEGFTHAVKVIAACQRHQVNVALADTLADYIGDCDGFIDAWAAATIDKLEDELPDPERVDAAIDAANADAASPVDPLAPIRDDGPLDGWTSSCVNAIDDCMALEIDNWMVHWLTDYLTAHGGADQHAMTICHELERMIRQAREADKIMASHANPLSEFVPDKGQSGPEMVEDAIASLHRKVDIVMNTCLGLVADVKASRPVPQAQPDNFVDERDMHVYYKLVKACGENYNIADDLLDRLATGIEFALEDLTDPEDFPK